MITVTESDAAGKHAGFPRLPERIRTAGEPQHADL